MLNSYSNRTSDVDLLTDRLEKAMEGFFDAVKAVLAESVPVADVVEAAPEPAEQALNETAEIASVDSAEVPNEAESFPEETVQEPVREPEQKIDFANVQYLDDGKGGVLKPNGTGNPGFDAYDTFVWSSAVTQGVGADGGPAGGSGKSGGLPVWVKAVPYVLGAGFIAAGIYQNSRIKNEREKYNESRHPEEAQSHWEYLETFRTSRNVFYGVGAGLVGIGTILTIAF